MSTKYIASNWRLPNEENSGKSDNYGLTFDGGSEYIAINDGVSLDSNGYSISVWFNANSFSSLQVLFFNTSSNIKFISIDSATSIRIRDGVNERSYTVPSMSVNNWYNIILTVDNGSCKVFLNTTESTTGAQTVNQNWTINGINGYSNFHGYSFNFNGSISEVAIFDYALSESQISTLYGSSSLGAGNPMALKPQPVAYYPLGDNSASNPLTQPNEAVEDASVFQFDGYASSDAITLGNTIGNGFTQITCSIWVKLSTAELSNTSTYRNFLVKFTNVPGPGPFELRGNHSRGDSYDNKLFFRVATNTGSYGFTDAGFALSEANRWYHIVGTYDGSNVKTFVDGVERSSLSANGTLISNSNDATIGFDTGTGGFDGEMSNAQIWNTALSEPEIETLYNSGVPLTGTQPQASSLKAWYKLDQSANWEADTSGNWQIPDAVSAYPQSFDFPASNDYISIGSTTLGINTAIAISAWVKTSVNTGYGAIIGEDNAGGKRNWNLMRKNDDIFFTIYHDDTGTNKKNITTSTINVSDNKWHHVLATWDGTTNTDSMKVYFDGVEVAQATPSSTGINTESAAPWIGNSTDNPSGYSNWTGQLSNIAIWNSDQSSEALNIYNSGVPATSYTNTPVAWYKLDNTATFSTNWSIPDASGNGNTGTSSGMTEQNLVNNNVSALNGESNGMTSANLVLSDLTRAVPYDSYSFNFDAASSDYIDLGTTIDLGTQCSFSVWLKRTPGSVQTVLGNNNPFGYQLASVDSGGTLGWWVRFGNGYKIYSLTSPVDTTDGNWHHYVISRNGATLDFYVDGQAQDLISTSGTFDANGSVEHIGADGGTPGDYYNGKISNISVFNEAITSTEVQKLYANGVPQDLANFTPAPIAWWPLGSNSFWNGSQWTVRDMIGSNDGTGQNIGIDGLVGDSPRSSANGVGTNMDIPTNLEGSTKWSDNNSWSINMSSTARVEDTP